MTQPNPDAKLREVCPELWELYLKAPPLLQKRLEAIKARMLELAQENEVLRKLTRALGEDHPASVKNFLKNFTPIKDEKIHEMFEWLNDELGEND